MEDLLLRDHSIFKVASTLFFVLFFAAMCLWLMRGTKEQFQEDSEIPLQDGRLASKSLTSSDAQGGGHND
ncbi:MAG: cbb3-type cytochrome c oxidase subunit 3 [Planctomycetes bacterium]|nr:cbb3-type cytochrome c oxidase subunit 3 [Planctomycetota bacterium]